MKPAAFDFVFATSEQEALTALARDPAPTVLAGGQTLLPLMNRREVRPRSLVDISSIREWSDLQVDDRLSIGAAVTQFAVEHDAAVRARLPVVAAALGHVGSVPVRVKGTWVGSLAHADPCAEIPMIAALLDGAVEVVSGDGARRVPYRSYLRAGEDRIAAAEVIRGFSCEVPSWADGWGFHEVSARANDRPIAAAAVLAQHADGLVSRFSAAICGEELGQRWMDSGPVELSAEEVLTACGDWHAEVRREQRSAAVPVAGPFTFGQEYAAHVAAVALRRAARSAVGRDDPG